MNNTKTILLCLIFAAVTLVLCSDAHTYNKSWDQGHQGTNPAEGETGWGNEDYEGFFEGKYSPKDCGKMCPVYAKTGELQKTYTDLSVAGTGPTLEITRTYLSQQWASSLLGHSWVFNFGKRMIVTRNKDDEKVIGVIQETGEKNFFKEYENGSLELLAGYGVDYELVKNLDGSYTIFELDGVFYDLYPDGKIERKVDSNGNALEFEYDANGCLSRITNASGNYIDFQPGPNGKIASVTDSFGRTVSYEYDIDGNLVSVTDPMDNTTEYTYNERGLLTSVTDPKGRTVYRAEYTDSSPPKVASFSEKDETYSISYFDDRTEKTDSSGNTWTYFFNEFGLIRKRVDPLGNEITGKHTMITATSLQWEQDAKGNRTEYTYDENGNVETKTDPTGNTWTYTYVEGTDWMESEISPDGVVTLYEYNANGNLLYKTEDLDGPCESTTSYTYDSSGRRTSVTDPLGNTTTYEYTPEGYLAGVTDPQGNKTTYTYDERGNKLTKTDPNGNTTTYEYDLMDRVVSVTDPEGATTEYAYDANGNRISETDPEGNTTEYTYDAYSRVTQITDPLGNQTTYAYDHNDNIVETTDPNGNITSYTYDALGRRTGMTDALGKTAEFDHDANGNLTAETDRNGHTTYYEYDSLNRLIKVTDPAAGETTYEYDANDNLVSLTDAKGNTTYFEYDELGRLVKEIRPQGQETSYAYDPEGNLIEKTDAKDQKTEYVYNDAGRLTTINYYAASADTDPAKTVTFTYDARGNHTGYDDGITSASYDYNAADQKLAESVDYGAFTKTHAYTYNANKLKKSFTSPDGITYIYEYNEANQPTRVVIPDAGSIDVTEYNWNRPESISLPGGATREFDYDPLMSTSQINSRDPEQNNILNYQYDYDKVGNITAKLTEHGDYYYTYDTLDRLTDADNPETDNLADESFTYDNVGNRLTSADTPGTWDYNQNNELLGYDEVSYEYDENGNMTKKTAGQEVTSYVYNTENRLAEVWDGEPETGTLTAKYYYDPFGRRLWKEVDGVRTYYHYADEGLVAEMDASGNVTKSYGWKPDGTWGTDPLFMKTSEEYYFYHNDHLGTPQKMTDLSGAVVWSAYYSSFGKAKVDQESTVVNNLRHPGQYFDSESGLHYNYYRYYLTIIGRFASMDPIGLSGGVNLFVFNKNNPINQLDPFGLDPIHPVTGKRNEVLSCHHNHKMAVTVGGTVSVLTKDYSWNTKSGKTTGHSSALIGVSLDLTIGESGDAEVGIISRNLGAGVNLGEGGIKGFSTHYGLSFPPTFGYGSVCK